MIDADHATQAFGQDQPPRQERGQPPRLAQHRQQGFPRDRDRERNFDPAGGQGIRRQGERCDPQGDRAGAFRRRLRSRDPRRTGDALERRRPQAARCRRRPGRDAAGQPRHQRLHGRHHHSARRRRAQAGRRRPQRTSARGRPTVSETNNMLERRANPVGRAATAGVPRISLGGLRLAVLDIEQTANFMIDMVFPAAPGRPAAVSDFGQWRGAGALLDRADDRDGCSAPPT